MFLLDSQRFASTLKLCLSPKYVMRSSEILLRILLMRGSKKVASDEEEDLVRQFLDCALDIRQRRIPDHVSLKIASRGFNMI